MMYTNLERYAEAYRKVLSKHWHPHHLEQAWPKLYAQLASCHIDTGELFAWDAPGLRMSYAHELTCTALGIPKTPEAIIAYITMDRG